MKMRYIGKYSSSTSLINGHVYECNGYMCVEGDEFVDVLKPIRGKTMFLRIIDEDDEEYLYPASLFEKVDTK
ncbi:MAG: hypothetical protein K6G68_01485 [Oscillospiraceae bacterium]|nr:hypothetical protein [Oscillospiraceae bacterium]